jgi:hypothetical protein
MLAVSGSGAKLEMLFAYKKEVYIKKADYDWLSLSSFT